MLLGLIPAIASIFLMIFFVVWLWQMLKLTRQNRMINSMTLKVILKYCQQKGVDIDIEKIQQDVEESIE